MPLSTNYRNKIIDICCRIVSTDGEVELSERIWMNKLCEHNNHAKELVGSLPVSYTHLTLPTILRV